MTVPSLSAHQIAPLLRTQLFGRNILCFAALDSTNREARRRASELPSGSVLIADEQTAGRGRFGKQWVSPAGEGLWMTALCRPEPKAAVGLFTLMAGLAACKALRAETGLDIRIKWPNDLIANERKLCGILGEILTAGSQGSTVIFGIGVNVSQTAFAPELSQTATSLYLQTGQLYDRSVLTAAVLNGLDEAYHDLVTRSRNKELIADCSALCATLGREVRVIRPDGEMTGKAHSIAADGALCVQTERGLIHVYAGEVSIRSV